jgi:transcriptional regulator PpsR
MTTAAKHTTTDAALALSDPLQLAAIMSSTADITVLLTSDGVVCDQVMAGPQVPSNLVTAWPGKPMMDIVTVESRPKIDQLISEATNGMPPRWRQVNHPSRDGQDVPISYSAFRAGPNGHIILIGRDMSSFSALQRRLLAAEQAMEQEYQRLRNSETRFRMLLQSATDAILIVDSKTMRLTECNASAATVLDRTLKRLQGALLADVLDDADWQNVKAALETLRTVGRVDDVVLKTNANKLQAVMAFSMFRQENNVYFLLRIVPHMVGNSAVVLPKAQSKVVKIINDMPDGFVVTDTDLNVLTTNGAFLELAQLASEEQARGNSLERWLGRQGVDLGLMISRLNEKGEVRNFHTIIRGQFGAMEDVIVSAVSVLEGETPCFGFITHLVSRKAANNNDNKQEDKALLRSVDEFTRLVGKMPLKELVRESTDLIERLCIEAALQMNGDNRANTAEMLGLSRQSLYMKLHRYGIDGGDSGDAQI